MKKIIFLTTFIALASIATYAQDSTHEKKQWAKDEILDNKQEMLDKLNLTPDQKDQMDKMVREGRKQRSRILMDESLTDDQKKAQMQELRQSGQKRTSQILSKDQTDQLQKYRAQGKHRYSKEEGAKSSERRPEKRKDN